MSWVFLALGYVAVAVMIVLTDALFGWWDRGADVVGLAILWPVMAPLFAVTLPVCALVALHEKLSDERRVDR